ncbi:MAG: hypothetical protein AAGJ18_10840 [Bacteroidota bacterium]
MKRTRRTIVSIILATVGIIGLIIGAIGYVGGGEIFYNEPFPFLIIGFILSSIGIAMLRTPSVSKVE